MSTATEQTCSFSSFKARLSTANTPVPRSIEEHIPIILADDSEPKRVLCVLEIIKCFTSSFRWLWPDSSIGSQSQQSGVLLRLAPGMNVRKLTNVLCMYFDPTLLVQASAHNTRNRAQAQHAAVDGLSLARCCNSIPKTPGSGMKCKKLMEKCCSAQKLVSRKRHCPCKCQTLNL